MASVRFTELQSRPMEFLDFTSVTLDEFQQLVPPFETAFQCHMVAWRMDGKPRTARRFTVYKTCPLPTPEDRLLFIRHLSTDLPCPFWRKASNFRGLFAFLLCRVATIKLAYNVFYP